MHREIVEVGTNFVSLTEDEAMSSEGEDSEDSELDSDVADASGYDTPTMQCDLPASADSVSLDRAAPGAAVVHLASHSTAERLNAFVTVTPANQSAPGAAGVPQENMHAAAEEDQTFGWERCGKTKHHRGLLCAEFDRIMWYDVLMDDVPENVALHVAQDSAQVPVAAVSQDSAQVAGAAVSQDSAQVAGSQDSAQVEHETSQAELIQHYKAKQQNTSIRYRYVFAKDIDMHFEAVTQLFVHLVRTHYQYQRNLGYWGDRCVFEYEPFSHYNWPTQCWKVSRHAMQDVRDKWYLQQEYKMLLSELPPDTLRYYEVHRRSVRGACQDGACAGAPLAERALALVKLSELHRGEVVQISRLESSWSLEEGSCPDELHPQLLCQPEGQPLAGKGSKDEANRWKDMSEIEKSQIQQEYGRTDGKEMQKLAMEFLPDWDRQKYLCVVPCRATEVRHWRRHMLCSTLGQLFRVLGKQHNAASMYYFYNSRKLGVRKAAEVERRKTSRAREQSSYFQHCGKKVTEQERRRDKW